MPLAACLAAASSEARAACLRTSRSVCRACSSSSALLSAVASSEACVAAASSAALLDAASWAADSSAADWVVALMDPVTSHPLSRTTVLITWGSKLVFQDGHSQIVDAYEGPLSQDNGFGKNPLRFACLGNEEQTTR